MSQYVWGNQDTQYFYELTPEKVLDAVEQLGMKPTGRILQLNSMENRVYEIEITPEKEVENPSDNFVIAKFYRPGRWSREQILDEHTFLNDLVENEIPAIAPIKQNGETLFVQEGTNLFFCFFPKRGGRYPDEMNDEQLLQLGRFIGRLHNTGSMRKSEHRLEITPETFGEKNLEYLLGTNYIPPHIKPTYETLVREIISLAKIAFKDVPIHRIHGDCHLGNVIYHPDNGFFFIDFDDMLMGPAVQDIWLIIQGRDEEAIRQRNVLLEGYEMMRDFPWETIKLIEHLRSLRYIHFNAWISKRWEDPSFKIAFPQFDSAQYWEVQIHDFREQIILVKDSMNQPSFSD